MTNRKEGGALAVVEALTSHVERVRELRVKYAPSCLEFTETAL